MTTRTVNPNEQAVNLENYFSNKYEGKLNLIFDKRPIVQVVKKEKPSWDLNQYIDPILKGWNKNKFIPFLKTRP